MTSQNQTLVLRPKAVANELQIGIATFWRLVKDEKIKTIKIGRRSTGVLRTELDRFLKQ